MIGLHPRFFGFRHRHQSGAGGVFAWAADLRRLQDALAFLVNNLDTICQIGFICAEATGIGSHCAADNGALPAAIIALANGRADNGTEQEADTFGAYYQILPKVAESAQFDPQMISAVWYPLVLLGSWAEMILPLFILLGLFTRGAALGMIGFIIVQPLTDIFGHGADATTIGGWFDRVSDALILDQRLLWVFLLLVLVVQGGGRYALDHWLSIDKSTE